MAKTTPFHSTNPLVFPKVYHNDTACTEGNNIEDRYWAKGTASRPLCQHCARL